MIKILDLLGKCFEYDVMVFSDWRLYVLIFPAMFYLVFFIIKWIVLTAPIWLPVRLALEGLRFFIKDQS